MSQSRMPEIQLPVNWNPRMSMCVTSTKGLLNAPGQNNCFLNSAVQVLWQLDVFRRCFRQVAGHYCLGDTCLFCALKVIFTQFQFSDKSALPPDTLRRALADAFADVRKFQLGHMDDAAECFENILKRVHLHVTNCRGEEDCAAPHCIAHRKFAMSVVEQVLCSSCGAQSQPLRFTQLVRYVPTTALCSIRRQLNEAGRTASFSTMLQQASAEHKTCPRSCGGAACVQHRLTSSPDVVCIGFIWESERPSSAHVAEVLDSVGTELSLLQLFSAVSCSSSTQRLQLVGLVCYYGKHYTTFFRHVKLGTWIYFDDANVVEVGREWRHVRERCRSARFQPLLLFYASSEAAPLDTSAAPSTRILIQKQGVPSQPLQPPLQQGAPSVGSLTDEAPAEVKHQRQPSFLSAVTDTPAFSGEVEKAGEGTGFDAVDEALLSAAARRDVAPSKRTRNLSLRMPELHAESARVERSSPKHGSPGGVPTAASRTSQDDGAVLTRQTFKKRGSALRADVIRGWVQPSEAPRTPDHIHGMEARQMIETSLSADGAQHLLVHQQQQSLGQQPGSHSVHPQVHTQQSAQYQNAVPQQKPVQSHKVSIQQHQGSTQPFQEPVQGHQGSVSHQAASQRSPPKLHQTPVMQRHVSVVAHSHYQPEVTPPPLSRQQSAPPAAWSTSNGSSPLRHSSGDKARKGSGEAVYISRRKIISLFEQQQRIKRQHDVVSVEPGLGLDTALNGSHSSLESVSRASNTSDSQPLAAERQDSGYSGSERDSVDVRLSQHTLHVGQVRVAPRQGRTTEPQPLGQHVPDQRGSAQRVMDQRGDALHVSDQRENSQRGLSADSDAALRAAVLSAERLLQQSHERQALADTHSALALCNLAVEELRAVMTQGGASQPWLAAAQQLYNVGVTRGRALIRSCSAQTGRSGDSTQACSEQLGERVKAVSFSEEQQSTPSPATRGRQARAGRADGARTRSQSQGRPWESRPSQPAVAHERGASSGSMDSLDAPGYVTLPRRARMLGGQSPSHSLDEQRPPKSILKSRTARDPPKPGAPQHPGAPQQLRPGVQGPQQPGAPQSIGRNEAFQPLTRVCVERGSSQHQSIQIRYATEF